uniref:Uncharacterized protein n=2 Tax=Oryza TaxID=4527 RepID=A0A0E0RI88_ORYRU
MRVASSPSSRRRCTAPDSLPSQCQIHWQAVDPAFGLPPVDPTAQSLAGAEDSELARRLRGPAVAMGKRLSFMNAYLAEDCNPVRCWVITAAVAFVTLIGIPGIKPSLLEKFGARLWKSFLKPDDVATLESMAAALQDAVNGLRPSRAGIG